MGVKLTLSAKRHVHVVDVAILPENLAQVILGHVLSEALDHNLMVLLTV